MAPPDIDKMRSELQAEVNAAAEEAEAAPQPEVGHITAHIYSDKTPFFEERQPEYLTEDTISMVEALNRGLREEVVRLDSHSSSDDQTKYRSEEELKRARESDPI